MANPVANVFGIVWIALTVALIAVGGMTTVPFGPVPFTLQGLFIGLAALVLGPARGALAMALYILLGVVGLPIFSGGSSGLGALLGPTGGYLVGYVFFSLSLGAGGGPQPGPLWRTIVLGLLALVLLYACGVLWLMRVLDLPLAKGLTAGMLPFLPADAVKMAASIVAWRFLARLRLVPTW